MARSLALWLKSHHRSLSRVVVSLVFVLISGVVYVTDWYASEPALHGALWHDTNIPVENRITDLLAHMTLREKIGQMALVEKNSITPHDVAEYGIGGVLSGAGAKPATNTPSGWAAMIAEFQAGALGSRLAIPLLYGVDAVHGHALVPGATIFPHQIGLGASGDSALVSAIAAATAHDLQATGVNWNYAPNLDMPQDIRWGRVYEAFSDDPLLVRRLGAAYVTGLQSTSTSARVPALATLKHYIGLGAMQWGTSKNRNFHIDQAVTAPHDDVLRSAYLPPFAGAIDAGALSVMVGLNTWGTERLITNHALITDELKGTLGFKGFVVSDWYGAFEGRTNLFMATVEAVNAGVDMFMLPFDYRTFVSNLTTAHQLGFVSSERIDDAVRRILRAKFALGMFDGESIAMPTETELHDHAALARRAVAESLVLLKNDHAVLPLLPTTKRLLVVGSAAQNVGMQSGAWTVEWQGVDGNWLPNGTSILAGIKARAPQGMQVLYNASGTFADTTHADIGIAIIGETPYAEGWGDRAYPIVSREDREAIAQLQTHCDKVVVIIVSGRPLLIANEVDSWDALVAAWLPGSEGAGVADVLFGDVPFSGTLPLPWPKTSEQLPLHLDGTTADGTEVLFPRYSGLAY